MQETTLGLFMLLAAGVMNGSFTLPMKFTHRWAWENTWLMFSFFALVVLPPLVTFLTVPQLGTVYAQVGVGLIIAVVAFGAGWGVAQVLFGLAVDAIGIALSFSIILGLSAAVGSIIPLVQLHADRVFTAGGLGVIGGVLLVLLGVAVCAVAGRRRETALGAVPAGKVSFKRGLAFAIGSGLGASLVNFGLAYGGSLIAAAEAAGAESHWAPNAVWLPLMLAGAVINIGYCVFLMRRNGTAARFQQSSFGLYYLAAALMGIFWFGSTVLYGMATRNLGELGPVLGWPLFMSLIVITASVWGMLTGEWKNSGKQPLRIMMGGVSVLVVAVFVLSAASRYI